MFRNVGIKIQTSGNYPEEHIQLVRLHNNPACAFLFEFLFLNHIFPIYIFILCSCCPKLLAFRQVALNLSFLYWAFLKPQLMSVYMKRYRC
jgi:hypothetical protein